MLQQDAALGHDTHCQQICADELWLLGHHVLFQVAARTTLPCVTISLDLYLLQGFNGELRHWDITSSFSGCKKHISVSLDLFILWQGFEGGLRHWDITFWAERLREARYQLTDEQLRPYFALPNVLDGLFQARLCCRPRHSPSSLSPKPL